jgi:hypothetical protein
MGGTARIVAVWTLQSIDTQQPAVHRPRTEFGTLARKKARWCSLKDIRDVTAPISRTGPVWEG